MDKRTGTGREEERIAFSPPLLLPRLRLQHRLVTLEDSSMVMPYCTGKFVLVCYLPGIHLYHNFKRVYIVLQRCLLIKISKRRRKENVGSL